MNHIPARVHVAAAVILDEQGRVLISRRPGHVHQGGLWEFPGGKLEPGETAADALRRETHEELGITVQAARPLIRVVHDYPDKSVLLDVWRVEDFAGKPVGCEGQAIKWVVAGDLGGYPFPSANVPIIKAVNLPDRYLITPEPGLDQSGFLATLERALVKGVTLVQLRARQLSTADYRVLVPAVLDVCRRANARLLLNAEPVLVAETGVDGVHLSSRRLMELSVRPLGDEYLVGASCHTEEEVRHAGALGLDFIVVSPVHQTSSHPGARLLGFEGLQQLSEPALLPVYALGGMQLSDMDAAFRHGAQGIAAISAFWG